MGMLQVAVSHLRRQRGGIEYFLLIVFFRGSDAAHAARRAPGGIDGELPRKSRQNWTRIWLRKSEISSSLQV